MSIGTTYKQEIKEASRRLLWQNAVRTLTQNRTSSRVINPNYMDNLWEYCKEEMALIERLPNMHDGVLEGLDNRRKQLYIDVLRHYCDSYGLQYIFSTIEDDVPTHIMNSFKPIEICLELNDEDEKGKLFGFNY